MRAEVFCVMYAVCDKKIIRRIKELNTAFKFFMVST